VTDPLTGPQKAYNAAQYEMFQLAAYGHCTYTNGEMLTREGQRQQRDYNDRITAAREQLEAAVLRLVAEKAETFRGDWGVVAAWLRSLADDPAAVSLLACEPDEDDDAAPAVPAGQAPATDRATLRDRIRRAVCEAEGFAWDSDMLEPDEYGDHADMVLSALIGSDTDLRQAIDHRDYWHGEAMAATARIIELERKLAAAPAAVSAVPGQTDSEAVQHAPGAAVLCPDCRAKGRSVCMADDAREVVHGCPPDGSGLTPCCGRTPFELPRTDRISSEAPVTCPGPGAAS
jgi:hypothetical protein